MAGNKSIKLDTFFRNQDRWRTGVDKGFNWGRSTG